MGVPTPYLVWAVTNQSVKMALTGMIYNADDISKSYVLSYKIYILREREGETGLPGPLTLEFSALSK